jgi:hypothetical protein
MLANLAFTRWDDKMTLPRKEEGCYMFMMTVSEVHPQTYLRFFKKNKTMIEKYQG